MRRWTITIGLAMTAACGGDDGAQDATTDAETGSAETDGAETSAADTGAIDTGGSTGAVDTGESGLESSEGADSSGGGDTTAGDVPEYAALVRGPLFTDDLAEAQAYHDMLAAGGEAAAMQLGDFGHDVVLGTTLFGTTENEFAAVDRWTSLDGAATFYGDPAFQRAFGALFAEPVAPQLFERRLDWHGWGELDSGDDTDPHFVVVVRGHLAADDIEESHALHDELASGGEPTATMLGDVAHVVWLGIEDPKEFFAIDVWTTSENIEAFYGNPDFQAAFAMLYDAPPSVAVYESTDWHQW